MNVSGIVVQTKPEFLESVIEDLKASGLCEYHFNDEKGRIIVTIEGETVGEETQKLKALQTLEHVIAADMQYSYSEEELDREREKFEDVNLNPVPAMLNDDSVRAEDISYAGDLKKKEI